MNKIYVLKINNNNKHYFKKLESAKMKMAEFKMYYQDKGCEILNIQDMSFDAILHGWNSIENNVKIIEIKLED